MTSFTFSVDSALLSELGEKLVESVHVALVELVKNSYDADATGVTIRFTASPQGAPRIEVSDTGSGMSVDDLQKYWMRIATTNKVDNNRSPIYGRWRTGAKGIGRFCCRRLGTHLELITTARVAKAKLERTTMNFSWSDFIAGTNVDSVNCPGSTEQLTDGQTGTTLIISGGDQNEWQVRGWDYLKRQLAVLVANRGARQPGYKEDPGFNITLDAPDFEGEVIDLREQLMQGGWGLLTGKVDSHGEASCHLTALGIGKKDFTFSKQYPRLKGISFEIGIITDKKGHHRNPKLISQGTLKEILPAWGGVQIRFNGFRVYPYGDDDWLNIDRDRGLRLGTPGNKQLWAFAQSLKGMDPHQALLPLLSMRSHVGTVEITGKAPGFEMKASREGFVRSAAISDLQEFVRQSIDWATIYRAHFIAQQKKQETETAREYLETALQHPVESSEVVKSAVEYIEREVKNIAPLLPSKQVERTFLRATDAILKRTAENTEELKHLRLIASTSTLLLIFTHEVKSLLGNLESSSGSLETIEKRLGGKDASRLAEIRTGLQNAKKRFGDLIEMTSLIGVDSRTATPEKLTLSGRIRDAIRCFDLINSTYDIKIDDTGVPQNLQVGPLLEAELFAVVLNVLSNSIKSVIATGDTKKISIEATRIDHAVTIHVRDNGVGLAPANYEDVFTPFIADPDGRLYKNLKRHLNPQDQYIVGTGSGLGLSIVKEIVKARGGDIRFVKPTDGWKADLEITLP